MSDAPGVARASLIVRGARVWTRGACREDADSVAVGGGRVLAVDRFERLAPLADERTEVVDAHGATVTPGLADAHLHFVAWARSLGEIALHDCVSAAECAARVAAAHAARPGDVLIGRGWDSNDWAAPPHRAVLDAAAPGVPVLLHSRDFHALWVNSEALARAGLGARAPDPEGGAFERDARGELTGVAREHAVRAFAAIERDASGLPPGATLERAAAALHALGVTAIHDFEGADAMRALGPLAHAPAGLRVLMHLPHAGLDEALALGLVSGRGDDRFRLGAVKLFADGTLGSRTAALLAPYEDGGLGMELMTREALHRDVARALAGGLAVAVHAIGDRACRNVLDACEAAGAALARPALPSRIEHLQLVHPDDVPRLAGLGVAASMQPAHCTADIALAERGWGARRAHAYPWRALLDAGARLAFGSDAPVEPPSVAEGLASAVTRMRPDGTPAGGWVPEQRVSLDEALEAYSGGAARLSGTWPRTGTLDPGAWADLVVWNRDLHALAPEALREARPALTLLEGRVVHRG